MNSVELVDTHAHLTDEQFASDLEQVIERARIAGLTRILTLGTDVASSRAAVDLAQRYPEVYAAVGVHPEAVREAASGDLDALRELAKAPKVVAIGEIGLDYYWDRTTAGLQQDWLERQLELAAALHLPVCIHDREAHEALAQTLARAHKNCPDLRGVLHSFSGDVSFAGQAIELGFEISFAGPVTFRNAKRPPEVARTVPVHHLLIETDSPYLAPHPLRGRRNEPANVAEVAARLAGLKETSVTELMRRVRDTARDLFRW